MAEMAMEDRVAVTRIIINILDNWGLSDSEQLVVLGLPDGTAARTVRKYRQNTPLPEEAAIMERVEHVAGIAEALRTTFPRNSQMGATWMRKPHRRLDQRSPLQTILEGGLGGLVAVRAQLDCAFAWKESES